MLGPLGALLIIFYQRHHSDAQVFLEKFREFNVRYDAMNEGLAAMPTPITRMPAISETTTTFRWVWLSALVSDVLFMARTFVFLLSEPAPFRFTVSLDAKTRSAARPWTRSGAFSPHPLIRKKRRNPLPVPKGVLWDFTFA